MEKCILWTDAANAFRVGYECTPKNGLGFRNHVYRDIDILHLAMCKRPPEKFWANCAIFIQPSNETMFEGLLFDDIRFDSIERGDIFLNVRTEAIGEKIGGGGIKWNTSNNAGRLRGCTLRNIHLKHPFDGETMRVHLDAKDAAHQIDGVVFEDVTGFGRVTAIRTSPPK